MRRVLLPDTIREALVERANLGVELLKLHHDY